ncbi:hypothetical protein MLD38_019962 [Melastoma candidum]|uniref:Uncharacterized protein n=1 Tax=Melastoma candidum TaxID=119954 RepID=A0ACB9QBM8_9MYRT|nr:hypothetical protein MLD38_019962 [Melastoma candidum]
MSKQEKTIDNKEWYLARYSPDGIPSSDHLKLRSSVLSLADLPHGHYALETLFVSLDPYLRSRLTGSDDGLYSPQFQLDQVITAFGIGRVVASNDGKFNEGDIVIHPFLPVAEYNVFPSSDFVARKLEADPAIPLPDVLGCLGVPGFAAWIAIEILACPKEGSNVFISAAAGGVGMYAGQLAKLRGCRVVGSTGSDDKVDLLKREFGYDDAFNYKKETDYDTTLSKYFPDGIDVYLDNVGGRMLEAVLRHVNRYARIPLCGMISQYNQVWTEREGVRNLLNAVGKEVRMEGFLLGSYLDRFGEFTTQMGNYLKEGKIKSKNKMYVGIEGFLEGLQSLFCSSNTGKVVLQVKEQ